LFDDHTEKTKLYKAIDDVKNRFGKTTLQKAVTVKKASSD
jgi:DNA polymerase-4